MPPSAIKPTSANHFEATYEAPFGGINNSSDPSDIPANDFADCTGFILQSNRLTTCALQNFRANQTNFPMILYPTTPVGDEQIVALFKCAGYMCAVDQYVNVYILTGDGFYQDQGYPPGSDIGPYSFYTINVIGSITLIGVPDPTLAAPFVSIYIPTVSLATATTYATGLYVGEISGYAIQLNTQQPSDTPQVNVNRVNWSAPYEYSTWNPLDSSENATGAGFDVISDSPESLTGFSAHGNVGYIYRPNGLIQLTVTGIAIQPFDFTPVTQGEVGIGCKYGESLVQFGGTDFFVAESGVYIFSSQFQNISEKAWNGIYASIVDALIGLPGADQYAGLILLYLASNPQVIQYVPAINGYIRRNNTSTYNPVPQYCLMIPTAIPNATSPDFSDVRLICWIFDIKTQSWYKIGIISLRDFLNLNYPLSGDIRTNIIATVQPFIWYNALAVLSSGVFQANVDIISDEMCYLVSIVYNTQNHPFVFYSQSILLFINTSGVLDGTRSTSVSPMGLVPCSITYRVEQVKLKRQVTIIRVIVKAAGFGTLIPTINGIVSPEYPGQAIQEISVTGTPIVVNSVTPANYLSSLVFTGENPQLTLASNLFGFDGYIVKAMFDGTYAEGDLN